MVQSGGVVAFPTDTVYGMGCNAFNPEAIAEIYRLKGRNYNKPLPILLADSAQLPLVASNIPAELYQLLEIYWPGPLTVVLKTAPLALGAARGKATIAVRVPAHGVALSILKAVGVPMATTSVNKSGKPAVTSGADVVKLFEEKIPLIVDGGSCEVGRESTVIDATHYPFTVLRQGAVPKNELAERLGLL